MADLPENSPIATFQFVDIPLVIFLLGIAIFSFPLLKSYQNSTVQIFKEKKLISEYPLSQDRIFKVNGELGPLTIEIKNGRAHIHSSLCKNQICVKAGFIHQPYQQIICAPNHIVLTVKAKNGETEIDAISH